MVKIMWIERLLAIFFPDQCVGCGRIGSLLCPACTDHLAPYPYHVERVPTTIDLVQVGYQFDPTLRAAIHQLKYRGNRRIARPLGQLLAQRHAGLVGLADCLIAIPLHPTRLAERGYNQAHELAQVLSRAWGIPALAAQAPHGLVRLRATAQQAKMATHERAANVAEAFAWHGNQPPPARVLLIDDVLTTGATMAACAAALRAAGSSWVGGCALARSRPDLDRQHATRPMASQEPAALPVEQ
jgi:ComF family protein